MFEYSKSKKDRKLTLPDTHIHTPNLDTLQYSKRTYCFLFFIYIIFVSQSNGRACLRKSEVLNVLYRLPCSDVQYLYWYINVLLFLFSFEDRCVLIMLESKLLLSIMITTCSQTNWEGHGAFRTKWYIIIESSTQIHSRMLLTLYIDYACFGKSKVKTYGTFA